MAEPRPITSTTIDSHARAAAVKNALYSAILDIKLEQSGKTCVEWIEELRANEEHERAEEREQYGDDQGDEFYFRWPATIQPHETRTWAARELAYADQIAGFDLESLIGFCESWFVRRERDTVRLILLVPDDATADPECVADLWSTAGYWEGHEHVTIDFVESSLLSGSEKVRYAESIEMTGMFFNIGGPSVTIQLVIRPAAWIQQHVLLAGFDQPPSDPVQVEWSSPDELACDVRFELIEADDHLRPPPNEVVDVVVKTLWESGVRTQERLLEIYPDTSAWRRVLSDDDDDG